VAYEGGKGKGSHGRVYLGSEYTTLKDPKKELGSGLLSKISRDLGIKPNDL
jgi:predicted RNA binding protein YcfA (HicA-like mRNA interferase family)